MKLTEILQPGCVKVPLLATEKQAAIFELVDVLADQTDLKNRDELKEAIWQREMTRTTGIGYGIAIPHGKTGSCPKLTMAVGLAKDPIEFRAIDSRPVDLIILLASPLDQTGPHIMALGSIMKMLTVIETRAAIKAAKDEKELYDLILKHQPES